MGNVIRGVEIFATGTHNGDVYTHADLDDMVAAAGKLDFRPALKLGHTKDAPGAPAYGWAQNLRREGDRLLADFTDMDDTVIDALRKRRYDRVSSEVYFNLNRKGQKYRRALKAVALLGADVPAVAELKPLHKMEFAQAGDFEKAPAFEQPLALSDAALIASLNEQVTALTEKVKSFGEGPGHPFRGNQWTDGEGEDTTKTFRDADIEAYKKGEKKAKYNGLVSPLMAGGNEGGKMLHNRLSQKTPAFWTNQQHTAASNYYAGEKARLDARWSSVANDAAKQAFGRDYLPTDYKISGIGSESFSDTFKNRLRSIAHSSTFAGKAADLHKNAAKYVKRTNRYSFSQEHSMKLAEFKAKQKQLTEALRAVAEGDGEDKAEKIAELSEELATLNAVEIEKEEDPAVKALQEQVKTLTAANVVSVARERAREVKDRLSALTVPAFKPQLSALMSYALENGDTKVKVYSAEGKAEDKTLADVVGDLITQINAGAARLFSVQDTTRRGAAQRSEGVGAGEDAGDALDKLTAAYMVQHPEVKEYSVAFERVCAANVELARAYEEAQGARRYDS